MSFLRRNDHVTISPWGGAASWFTILRDAKVVEDVAWSYERPFSEANAIAGHMAFAAEHVDVQIDTPAPALMCRRTIRPTSERKPQ